MRLLVSNFETCSYLPDKRERQLIIVPTDQQFPIVMEAMNEHGFRRSQNIIYRPHCSNCQKCMATRIVVKEFEWSKRWRRVLAANSDIQLNIHKDGWGEQEKQQEQQIQLIRKYLAQRHPSTSMIAMQEAELLSIFAKHPCQDGFTISAELDNQLVALSQVDTLNSGFSAVYTVFDPKLKKRGLGNLLILLLIKQAQEQGLDYVFLGYWVPGSKTMEYKLSFKPIEIHSGNQWHRKA